MRQNKKALAFAAVSAAAALLIILTLVFAALTPNNAAAPGSPSVSMEQIEREFVLSYDISPDTPVYIAEGGGRFHIDPECSSIVNADAAKTDGLTAFGAGYEACKICTRTD